MAKAKEAFAAAARRQETEGAPVPVLTEQPVVAPAQKLSEQTLAEMAAGKATVAERERQLAEARAIQAKDAAAQMGKTEAGKDDLG